MKRNYIQSIRSRISCGDDAGLSAKIEEISTVGCSFPEDFFGQQCPNQTVGTVFVGGFCDRRRYSRRPLEAVGEPPADIGEVGSRSGC